jgi:hypothetical protein
MYMSVRLAGRVRGTVCMLMMFIMHMRVCMHNCFVIVQVFVMFAQV